MGAEKSPRLVCRWETAVDERGRRRLVARWETADERALAPAKPHAA